MPRVVQVFDSTSSTRRMPNSSAGDSPRPGPAKPVRPTGTPRALNFGPSSFTQLGEDDENNIDIKSSGFTAVRDNTRSLTPTPGRFSSGSLAEAAAELKSQSSPFQRSKKWLKSGLNSPRAGLSERSLNSKINQTGSLFSSPAVVPHHHHHQQSYDVITAEEETPEKEKTEPASSSSEAEAVVVPRKLLPHKIGIQNRGNTCYLNSTVQALLGLPMLVTDAVNLKSALEKLEVSTEGSRLVVPFTAICQAQTRADVARTNVNAMRVKRDMEQLDSQFAGNKMQDANEFLCRFLDELKENVGKIYSESGSPSELVVEDDAGRQHRLTNLVDTNFQYERQETFACCACGHRSHVKHSDVNFFCDVSDSSMSCSVSLQQLVEQTLAQETREKRCDSCQHETAETSTKITKLPRVLLLFLKRYKYMAVGGGTVTTSTRKVTRLVDIPASINLDSIVSEDVTAPNSLLPEPVVLNKHTETEVGPAEVPSADSSPAVPATPKKSDNAVQGAVVPYEGLGTPIKFKGKTEEELSKLNEEEQTEYLLYISQKEALTSQGREAVFVNEDEDEELKAALEASLLDVGGEDEVRAGTGVVEKKVDEFKTPRKRQRSLSSLDSPPTKVARHTGGVFSHTTESLLKRADTPSPEFRSEKKVSWKKSFHRPESQAEEEADMIRALELSTQGELETRLEEQAEQKDEEEKKEVVKEDDVREEEEGDHCYRLASVVSHFGASTAAGHYVADVHRFDAGGWFRYDDTTVTDTNINSVRSGSNKANGYIFMYVHKSLWDQCSVRSNNYNNPTSPLSSEKNNVCDSSSGNLSVPT